MNCFKKNKFFTFAVTLSALLHIQVYLFGSLDFSALSTVIEKESEDEFFVDVVSLGAFEQEGSAQPENLEAQPLALQSEVIEEPQPKPVVVQESTKSSSLVVEKKPAVSSVKLTSHRAGSGKGKQGAGAGRVNTGSYEQLLASWINRFKRYPEAAMRRRIEGDVLLQVKIARNGEVVAHKIFRTSGNSLLDTEAENLIARANPLPAMPKEISDRQFEFLAPVSFSLN